MGTSLSYATLNPVEEPTRNGVIAFLQSESKRRDWWAESIILFDNPQVPGQICGDTKLFCLLDDDDAADCWMAMKDAEYIIGRLEMTSKKHRISWDLHFAGEPAGRILNGVRDRTTSDMLTSFDLITDVEDADFSQYDRESLLRKYPDR